MEQSVQLLYSLTTRTFTNTRALELYWYQPLPQSNLIFIIFSVLTAFGFQLAATLFFPRLDCY